MSTFTLLFLSFFGSAFLILASIVMVLFPSMCKALIRSVRLILARRRRDLRYEGSDQFNEDALDMEGLYRFEET